MSDEQERIPREIRRTLRPGESWTIREIESITITVESRDASKAETRIVATVLDREGRNV